MKTAWKMVAVAGASVAATAAAGALALSTMSGGIGRFGGADANGDGTVTRAEWVTAANARFTALDANKDGSLAVGELPRKRGHGRGHRGHPACDREGFGEPPAAVPAAPAAAPIAQPATPVVPAPAR